MERNCRHFSGTEKVAILRRHLIDSVPISDLCAEYDLQAAVFHSWLTQFFENGAAAFEAPVREPGGTADPARIAALEQKIFHKQETLSELMEEHIMLKKQRGES